MKYAPIKAKIIAQKIRGAGYSVLSFNNRWVIGVNEAVTVYPAQQRQHPELQPLNVHSEFMPYLFREIIEKKYAVTV